MITPLMSEPCITSRLEVPILELLMLQRQCWLPNMSIWTGPEASGGYSVVAAHRLRGNQLAVSRYPIQGASLLVCSLPLGSL
jgi:hypothetical protein